MTKSARLLTLLCLLPALASAQLKQPANFPVVKVGQTEFSRGKVDSMVVQLIQQQFRGQKAPQGAEQQMRALVVENLVAGELVRQEVAALKISPRKSGVDSLEKLMREQVTASLPDKDFKGYLKKMGYTEATFHKKIEEQVASEQLVEQVAPFPPDPTEAEVKKFFDENPGKFPNNDSVAGFAIVLKVKPGEKKEVVEEKTKLLEGLASQVRIGKADFRQLAASYSDDPQARKTGGLVEPFVPKSKGSVWAKEIGKIKVGQITGVFRDKDQLVLFALAARNDGKYESFRDQIAVHLMQVREVERTRKLVAWLQGLQAKYGVKYFDKAYEPSAENLGASLGKKK